MASTNFDIGPLTWVRGEIEQALARAAEAVRANLANPGDTTQIKFCKTHLHQAHGALEIVGLDGVTRLTEECERLLDAIADGSATIAPDGGRALCAAFEAVTAYLADLAEGIAHQPLRLFPVYKSVLEARGAERIVESDLFFPDLSPRPPRREMPELPADFRDAVIGQRRRFQSGLLRWLRNAADNAALRDMIAAVRAIEKTQALAQHRAFWWVTIGFTETLVAVGAQSSLQAKRLCARIDLQMKRLMEGSPNVAENLLRDTLYFVARSRVETPQVSEIRRVYALDEAIPATVSPRRDSPPREALLRALREDIGAAKDKWNRFAAGRSHELAGFVEHVAQLRAHARSLDHSDLTILVSAIASVAAWVGQNPGRVTEAIALETATALLLAESAAENFARLSSEFPQQVMAMGARMAASLAGESTDVAPPVLDEIARKAQERMVMAQVVAEIRSSLAAIEATLDGFFRDSARQGELPALDAQLRQVAGALSMLGADRAVEALAECRAEIARFAVLGYVSLEAEFEKVAHLMSGLGFYVEALQHGPAEFDAFLQPVAARRPQAPEEETLQMPATFAGVDFLLDESDDAATEEETLTVEAELEAQRRDTRTIFEAWRDKPGDSVLAAELKANLESIQQDADLVDEQALKESAGRALELLEQPSQSGTSIADIEVAMAEVSPELVVQVIVPSDEVRALADSSDAVVDAELLAIFLEEAHVVLGTIDARCRDARVEPSNLAHLTVIRRGFHTLKGSGRMVGLARLGETAWALEQVMNQWLQDAAPASDDLLAMVSAAHALFSHWIADLSGAGASAADGAPLIAACERMRGGELFSLPEPARADAGGGPTEALPSPERSIIIGDMRLSPGLYYIFVDEAGTHLAAMESEIALMTADAQAPRDQLLRAAHTLAGIAGTVSFRRLHELSRAFERALLVAKSGGIVPDRQDLALLQAVVAGIGALVNAVRDLREPPPQEPLEAMLEATRARWLAESGEIDPALLHVELPPIEDEAADDAAARGVLLHDSDALAPTDDGSDEGRDGAVDFDFSDDAAGALSDAPALDLDLPLDVEATMAVEIRFAPLEAPAFMAAEPSFAAGSLAIDDADGLVPLSGDMVQDDDADADMVQSGVVPVIAVDEDGAGPAPAILPAAAFGAADSTEPESIDTRAVEFDAGALDDAHSGEDREALASAAMQGHDPTSDAPTVDSDAPETTSLAGSDASTIAPQEMAWTHAAVPPGGDGDASDEVYLRARGFDPADRLLARIEDEIDAQLLPIFLEESAELVPLLGQQLRAWSEHPDDARVSQALQRTLHTLKGSARMAGAMAIGQVAHSMETRVENALGLAAIPSTILDGLITSYDRVNFLLEALRDQKVQIGVPVADAAPAAHAHMDDHERPPAAPAKVAPLAHATTRPVNHEFGQGPQAAPHADEGNRAMLRVRADLVDRLVNEAGEVAIARSRIEGELRSVKASLKDLTDSVTRLRTQLREIEIAAESQMQSRQREAEEKHESFDPLEFDRFTRFQEVARMMAESVNDVGTVQKILLKNVDDAELAILAQARLNRDLQADLMRVRMVPFNNVAERLYRVVRQTAKELGKRANLDIRGVQAEIDRSVLERMTGPFEHLLRNAIAHGIESPAARVAAAKNEIGQIVLSVRQEGNEFILVFEDDGSGLDLAAIRARAIDAGLAREGDVLGNAQLAEFIFAPGFSTAGKVSAIAGRGVGMDVVRAEVAALGGRIDTESTAGRGACFTIALPLTLALTQVVLVRTGSRHYAVPSVTVEQVRQLKAEDLAAAYRQEGIEWQQHVYPLFYLPRLLGDAEQAAESRRFAPVLLVRSGIGRVAIQVDELVGNQEVVVKNIGPQLARVTGIAGATVLGNGRIVLILNPVPLALSAASSGAARDGVGGVQAAGGARRAPAMPLVMVVDDSLTVRRITARLLSRENYQVVTARDGVDALEQLQKARPDIMLVDIEMPRMDGFDLTRNVRADDALKDIPIIMITSRTADKHRKYAMEVGANLFLGKPYQEQELLESIANLVKPVTA